jgi:hypothetical protein
LPFFKSFSVSTLPLLVLCVDANHSHHAFPLDDLALVANFFNACSNFHRRLPPLDRHKHQKRSADIGARPAFHASMRNERFYPESFLIALLQRDLFDESNAAPRPAKITTQWLTTL